MLFPVSYRTCSSSSLWSASGNSHIRASIDGKLFIYSATNSLHTLREINAGDELAIPLYLVRLGDERFKVVL